MTISSRIRTVGFCAVFALSACSREEPPKAPPAAPGAAAKAAPGHAAHAPSADTPEVSAEVAGDPRIRADATAEEPGFLTAFADADETVGDAPLAVKLNVEVVDNTGTPPFTFIWDFGDATEFSKDKSPSHTYKFPGNFRASVIIRDSKGEVDQDYIDVAVSDPNAPSGITAEQLMQQVPLEEIMRKARENGAAPAEGGKAAPPADDGEE